MLPAARAAGDDAREAADKLYNLGLFQGTGTDAGGNPIYNLDRAPTRQEAITMLVRLLGKEPEAKAGKWTTPFRDVDEWAKPYVGYAYTYHLTGGVSSTAFGGSDRVTASQYITFILRALGYSSGTDFKWDDAFGFSDGVGITDGRYSAANNTAFTRGDIAIISASALNVKLKGSDKTLFETLPAAEPLNIESLLQDRKLSDAQISAMKNFTPAQLKSAIATPADAITYLNSRFSSLWQSYHLWQGSNSNTAVLRSGDEILAKTTTVAGRSDMCTALAYLLSDDLNVGAIYGFWHLNNGSFAPIKSVNYIRIAGTFYIFDPVKRMSCDMASRYGALLPEATVSNLEGYTQCVMEDIELHTSIDSLYAISGGQSITFTDSNKWATISSPAVTPFYANEDKNLTEEEYQELKYGHIKAGNIGNYKLSKILGGLTLTPDGANALVGKSPKEIKASVKTAGDMLMYMLASKTLLENGDQQIFAGGYQWHYNHTAREVLSLKLGNCGSMANLANFLLEGDYEEVGFIQHSYYPGCGGGHVYNYIKYQGKYYIVDFSSYLFSNYSESGEFNFISMTSLTDYGTRWKECYGGLAAIIAHTSPGTHYPIVWEGDGYYFPENAQFTVLYETPGTGYEVRTLPCPPGVPDWTKPQ